MEKIQVDNNYCYQRLQEAGSFDFNMVDRTTSVSRRFTQHTTTASGGDGGENNILYTAKKRHHAEVSILCLPGPNISRSV